MGTIPEDGDMTILLQFIRAERTAHYELYLTATREMLPFFASAGNHNYTKGARMMIQLHDELCRKYPDVVNEFFLKGHHIVRYSDGNWGGVWSDMAIEQTLMKSAKTIGGLAHGALRDPNVLMTWVLTVPHTSEVSDAMLPV